MPTEEKVNILLVDDRPENLLALEAILEDLDQNLVTANSGKEALKCLLRDDFAVILLDVQMPGMDGFETAELIRSRERSQRTPIIFITAIYKNDISVFKGYSLGAVDYIVKPFEPEVLRAKVKTFVELFREVRTVKEQAEGLRQSNLELSKAIRSSEERYHLLMENVRDYAIFMLTPEGYVDSWNVGAERILGYTEAEIMGQPFSCLFTPGDIWDGKPQEELLTAAAKGRAEEERWHVQKDGTYFWATGVITALRDENGKLLGFAKVLRNFTEQKQAREEREHLIEQLEKERTHLEAVLAREQEARKDAEVANRTKDEFLTTISHELRTPLTSMLGWTRLLRSGKLDTDMAERALQSIERNAKSQAQIVDDILDVSRIIMGNLRLDIIPVELAPVIKGAIETIRPAAEAKSIDLQVELDASVSPVVGDPNRLQQIIWNLLSNAVKFTPREGRVTVRLECVGSSALITVRDTGLGINPEFLPYVFDRFRQADSTSTRRHGGLGLGLAIVRHLVELHGGTVHAQSLGEGQGATFSVLLPLAAVRLERGRPNCLPAPSQKLPSLGGVHVLLVDDDADTLDMLTIVLQQSGARVTAAMSSDQALEALEQSEPDVILSDIGMPDEDGYDLIQKVRAWESEQKRQVPAVALTAYAKPEDRQRILEAGFQMYVSKPVEPVVLTATIAKLLGRGQKVESA